MSDDYTDSLSSPGDPWSSHHGDPIVIRKEKRAAILTELANWRACTDPRHGTTRCRYAADFEITDLLLPMFPEIYEGEIRRHTRAIRGRGELMTVTKKVHKHYHHDTHKWVQCHRLPPKAP